MKIFNLCAATLSGRALRLSPPTDHRASCAPFILLFGPHEEAGKDVFTCKKNRTRL